MTADLNRREVLRIVAASGLAAPMVLAGSSRAEAAEASILVGILKLINSDTIVIETSSGQVDVNVQPTTRMYSGSDGQITSTAGFYLGDRLVVQGWRSSDGFFAGSIGSAFAPMQAYVKDVNADGSVAQTSLGPILLSDGRLPFTSQQEQQDLNGGTVTAGTVISGLSWRNPSTGEQYLMIHG